MFDIALVHEPSEYDCEMGLYSGRECHEKQVFAIIDTRIDTDPAYPQGFHVAHACGVHALTMFLLAEGEDD